MENINPKKLFREALSPDIELGLHAWRIQMLTIVVWCTLILGGIPYWVAIILNSAEVSPLSWLLSTIGFIWLLLMAYPRLPYQLRAMSVSMLVLVAGGYLIYLSPYKTLGACYLFVFPIFVLILQGWRLGIVAALVTASALAVYNYLPLIETASVYVLYDYHTALTLLLSAVAIMLTILISIIPLAVYVKGSDHTFSQAQSVNGECKSKFSEFKETIEGYQHNVVSGLRRETAISEIVSIVGSSPDEKELVKRTLNSLFSHFHYSRSEVIVYSDSGVISHVVHLGESSEESYSVESNLVENIPESVFQVIHQNQMQTGDFIIVPPTSDIPYDVALEFSTVCIPLAQYQNSIGALIVAKPKTDGFPPDELRMLQSVSRMVAMGINDLRLSMAGMLRPDAIQLVNQAIHLISQANYPDQVVDIVADTLTRSPFISAQFSVDKGRLLLDSFHDTIEDSTGYEYLMLFPIENCEEWVDDYAQKPVHIIDMDSLPDEINSLFQRLDCRSAATLSVLRNGRPFKLYILAARQADAMTAVSIQPYANLTAYATAYLEKILITQHLNRRVAALQSLASISQTISIVTDLQELFDTIHEQITQVIGEVDLAIALYDRETDQISIPYAHEAGQKITLDPFPLGQGLTSLLIRTQQPLMLVEDTERRALAMGAKVAGAAAKSWLGVPMSVSGEVFGAIILQDTVREQRFDDGDLRLVTTLASQVAITIRNVRLLQDAKHNADKERIIANISSRIWALPDIESVARTALQELGQALNASSGTIKLHNPAGGAEVPEYKDASVS